MANDITYPNALASNGKIVNVNDPEFQDRTLTYTCLGCGEPMSAVHRTTGQSHFRHINSNPNCNPQTYLHRLAKRTFKDWFDSGKPFVFKYKSKNTCQHFEICPFRGEEEESCMSDGYSSLDLHTLYDTCEEEVRYKGFIGDLVLRNSLHPEQSPLFLEIAVTHKCEEEKIASGIPIIELNIQSEEDIKLPISEIGNPQKNIAPSSVYNFDRKVKSTKIFHGHQLKASGLFREYQSIRWRTRTDDCSQLLSPSPTRNTLFELYFAPEDLEKVTDADLQKLTWARCSLGGVVIPDFCIFCNKARIKDPETGKLGDTFCKQSTKTPLKSLRCPGFEFEPAAAKEIAEQYSHLRCLVRGLQRK